VSTSPGFLFRAQARSYLWLKIAKAQIPVLNRVRLLKKEAKFTDYGGRPVVGISEGNSFLLDGIAGGRALAAGKIGDVELEVLVKYERCGQNEFFRSISRGHELNLLHLNSGVFPKTEDVLVRWVATYLDALSQIDLLGVWHNQGEKEIIEKYAPQAMLTGMMALEPYYHHEPWSSALADKHVVVVTPFAKSLSHQHARRAGIDLFPSNPDILPEFELTIVQTPFSAGVESPRHPDWHAALHELKQHLSECSFDVCLIGAGAWSLPLCAFVRSTLGRPAIHLGGPLQILFGIRGARWERHPFIKQLFNQNWIRPLPQERPRTQWKIEGGAYW
jgi:hypothetical protein